MPRARRAGAGRGDHSALAGTNFAAWLVPGKSLEVAVFLGSFTYPGTLGVDRSVIVYVLLSH